MHCMWENLLQNLILHWTGEFKGLNDGKKSYKLQVPNVAKDKSTCTADMWSFWTLYIGPVLLWNQYQNAKYYRHFVKLVSLLNTCLQFEITKAEIQTLQEGFVKWVVEYKNIYYQHNASCLLTSPVTIHALLHVADSIKFMGPDAQLTQVKAFYDISEELALCAPHHTAPQGSLAHKAYPLCILLPPRKPECPIDNLDTGIVKSIAAALLTRFSIPVASVRKILKDASVQERGKSLLLGRKSTDTRDATFLRYEMLVDKFAKHKQRKPEFRLKTSTSMHFFSLATIRNCKLAKEDVESEKLDIHLYSGKGSLDVVNITSIQALVGRVKTQVSRGDWAIIDCSGTLAQAIYDKDNE
ncbi:hypothetical protein B0H34DRAFT_783547 [Crassisporium funariophilum]|nr:hypothetical protein B0H34DRAFT_783547 [Crassisporium funariophilum]